MLPSEGRRHPGIACFGEVAVPCASDEPAVTRRLEPSSRLAIRDDRLRRSLLLEFTTTAAAVTTMASSIPLIELPPLPTPISTSALAPLVVRALTLVLPSASLSGRGFVVAWLTILIRR